MGFRSNQPTTGRDFFFSPSGNDELSGTSDENPVSTPLKAIEFVNALSLVPSGTDPASINASVTGTYSDALILPDSTSINCAFASILTTDQINITSGRGHSSIWGSLLNFSSNCTIYKIAGKDRVRAEINAMVVGIESPPATNCVGFDVSGSCDDIFIRLVEAELRGDGAVLIDHTATSPTPIDYNIEVSEFFNTNQTLMDFNPPNATDQASINISVAQEDLGSTTTGSMLFNVLSGRLIVKAEVLQADDLCVVASGASLSLDCQIAFGDVLIKDGGDAILKSIGLLVGDITVEAGATLECIINRHVGTITNNGTINGTINGQRFGNWTPQAVLTASSLVSQEPVGTDNPLQINYGAAQGTVSDPVMLAADGTITINESGFYDINATYSVGRQGAAGGTADIFIRGLLDAAQVGNPISAIIDTPNVVIPIQLELIGFLEAGAVLTGEIVRDSAGMDDGGIFSISSSIGWGTSPSAAIRIFKT